MFTQRHNYPQSPQLCYRADRKTLIAPLYIIKDSDTTAGSCVQCARQNVSVYVFT